MFKYYFLIAFLFPNFFVKSENLVINLPKNHWASQQVISHVLAKRIQDMGYSTKFIQLRASHQLEALANGVVDFQIELWVNEGDDITQSYFDSNKIIDIGKHDITGKEEWWFPEYMKELCPELPSWRTLNKCAHLFALDNDKEGTFYTGLWNYRDSDLIRSLGLNFKIKRFKNETELWKSIDFKLKNKEAVIFLNWSPNWIELNHDGEFVNFPEYNKECEIDPQWGLNRQLKHDCANPPVKMVTKVISPSLANKAPCIVEYLKQITLDNSMIAYASKFYFESNNNIKVASKLWMNKFSKQLSNWDNKPCTKL